MVDDYVIITREAIRRKGAAAFAYSRGRDSHGFNPGSAAIAEFHAGYDTASAIKNATTVGLRVDLAQKAAA